jgi:carboxylesterase type B
MTAVYLMAFATVASVAAAVKVEGGLIEGIAEAGITVYKGIPFAAPPTGNLRWRPPQPVKSWDSVLKVDHFAPACPQVPLPIPIFPKVETSEDCLYLNVWTPAQSPGENLPVMVWIYGGGFALGATSTPLYSGEQLAKMGVIVVSIAYRVGPLGFLAHPDLTAESPRKVSGNYGLLDQIAALEWVQRNIKAFGGNPGGVTIFGESAGGISVSMLAASPLAKGLFQRAICESGGSFSPGRRNKEPDSIYYFDQKQPPSLLSAFFKYTGAPHGSEMPYTFQHLDQTLGVRYTDEDRKLSETMATYWTNFAKKGNPNGAGLPQWPAFSEREATVMYLDSQPHTGPVPNVDKLTVLDEYFAWKRASGPEK